MTTDRYSRQSFLGADSQEIFSKCRVGIVGLGGGGMHIVQQLSHIGFKDYVLYDHQPIELSNLNRTVGAKLNDVKKNTLKINIAKRIIMNLQKNAKVHCFSTVWQENPGALRECDIVFGCVDGYAEREKLEVCSRRYLIPYIDIGMDVFSPPRIAGQVILSMPGEPCLKCLKYLNEKSLAIEAERYGDAGNNPQVIWANGVLASTAVALAVDLLTDWTGSLREVVYLSYDGNKNLVSTHPFITYNNYDKVCSHYTLSQVGDPVFTKL